MSCGVVLQCHAKSGTGNDVVETFRSLLPDTRTYDGCIDVVTHIEQDNSDTVMLVEHWETKEKYEVYLNWRVERGDIDKLKEMLSEEPSLRFFSTTDAQAVLSALSGVIKLSDIKPVFPRGHGLLISVIAEAGFEPVTRR